MLASIGGAGGMVNRDPMPPLQAAKSLRLRPSTSSAVSHPDGAG